MTELARLKFYATQPHTCSYLPDEQATTQIGRAHV